ncbi:hypothetical protein PDR5_23490 [Pseudomonas sp. DR 5-09]|jgi:hypothetical protein|nr:hypothetical protein PDR5_23490 [Pseudomonas sp. DR 5-09]
MIVKNCMSAGHLTARDAYRERVNIAAFARLTPLRAEH